MLKIALGNRSLMVADNVLADTLQLAEKAAKRQSPVFLCGESGTGKEIIARYIHEKSDRAKRPFVSVNCAAIPEGLLESELFGHEKGAFTGASVSRAGKFEQANHGVLLLDEISEMSCLLQAKLLRALQEGEIDRLGGRQTTQLNTRVIATTNRNPRELVAGGLFREDLYYRLNVIRIECRPLRGRVRAIENLAYEFLMEFSDGTSPRISEQAMKLLTEYSWPGNIRELRNAIERAVWLADENPLGVNHFDFHQVAPNHGSLDQAATLSEVEKKHILKVLGDSDGNRTAAAKVLGISVRTLRNKLNLYRAAGT